ncbi:hypothetical protein QMZ92_06885 [Streptomyces sp. HNM0645]|uniref:hypothetical protein n=1 Tax=Streptomyces sp. HNM0645 TaxID=2782343 RepID=UPI0024B7F755|nr:hypothetical protein [Streptomyces sp. HNM0645]MDI9884129.1 hypothetical protein [Streptomyces sp. HNM0645]
MADERYEWLDQEAAERLLRGEPVEPVGVDARHQALRLAELLGDARAQEPVTEPLRGEDAALAAFRKARDGGGAELLPTVRLTPEARPVSWGRPLRWGLAVSLAGFAVGGVAVAAGVGVLPTPFGSPQPAPASSVPGAVTPGPVTSESPPDELRSDLPSPADRPSSPSAPAAPGGTDTPDGPGDGPGAGPGRDESTAPHDGTDGNTNSTDWYRRTVDACRDYRNGTLDEERKRKLEAAAQGTDRVKRFCDRMLSVDGRGDDGGEGGGDSGGNGDGGQGGGDDGDDGDDGSGPGGFPRSPFLPPTSVRPGPVEQPFVPPTGVRPAFRPAAPGAPVSGPSLPGTSDALLVGGRLSVDAVRTLSIATL